jgi:hypothetical protein
MPKSIIFNFACVVSIGLFVLPAPTLASTVLAHSNISALSNGLVGYWPFDGNTTSWTTDTTQDMSGNGNTGSMINMSTTTSPVAGKIGQALKFNGTSQGMSAPINLSGTNTITLSFWMKQTVFGSSDQIAFEYSTNYNSNNDTFLVDTGSSGTGCSIPAGAFYASVDNSGGPSGTNAWYFTQPSAGVWFHYSLVIHSSFNTPDVFYIDGQKVTATASTGCQNTSSANFANTALYMMSRAASSLFNSGQLDDVRIYNRALSAQEAQQLYLMGH